MLTVPTAAGNPSHQQPQQQQHLLLAPTCWKSTPGAGSVNGQQPPPLSLSVSAILPLSAVCSRQQNQQQQQSSSSSNKKNKKKKDKSKQLGNDNNNGDDSDRTMLPAAAGAIGSTAGPSLARRFFANPRVRRSLAIDIGCVAIFVPLAISTSLALMRLFVQRVGPDQLEWHHYLLVAALASLVLVPVCRLAYSGHRYRRRLRRMAATADNHRQNNRGGAPDPYTTKSRRIEAADAARAQEYRQFACLVAKQQNIDLSRRDLSGAAAAPAPAENDRSVGNVSGISCHRPDISMAAYNC